MFDLGTGIVVYCILIGVFFLVIWLAYDRRDHRRFELERRRTSFHCIRCDHVYAVTGKSEQQVCPRCGHSNSRLKY